MHGVGYGRAVSTPPFVDLPAGATVDRWAIRGTERAVMHIGLEGADSWAVLVPGFTGSKEDFIAVLPLLAEAGVAALAYDQLGQYQSTPAMDPSDYAIDLLAADLVEIVRVAGVRHGVGPAPHVVGHSLGGLVAQAAVARGELRPASLALLCSGPGPLPGSRGAALPPLVDALEHSDLATIWRIMRELEEAEDVVRPPAPVMAFLEERWHANSPVQLRELALLLLHHVDITPRVAEEIDGARVVVVWGENDDAWPIADQQRMARILGATQIELPGVAHSPNVQDPALLVEALLREWGR
jgi:pimeloyl-ACP methyl ester carboxylesterase